MATDGPMNDNIVNPLFGKVAPADVHAAISSLAEDMVITEEEEQELRQALFINKYGESFSSSTTPDEAALNLNIDAARAAWKNTHLEGSPSFENNINIDGHMYTAQEIIKAYIDYAIQMQNNQGGNTNMANVKFKRGLQANLLSYDSTYGIVVKNGVTIEDGTFYLTTDTNRLFVGKLENGQPKLVELNQSITILDSIDALKTKNRQNTQIGQFFYIKGQKPGDVQGDLDEPYDYHNTHAGNILAVCVGFRTVNGEEVADFVQVNPDTNTDTDTKLSSVSTTATTPLNNSLIPYEMIFGFTDIDNHSLSNTVTASFSINPAQIYEVSALDSNITTTTTSNQAQVDIGLKYLKPNGATATTATTTGSHFTIKGGSNVSVTKDDNGNIVIGTGIGSDSVQNFVKYENDVLTQSVLVNSQPSGTPLALKAKDGLEIAADSTTTGVWAIGHSMTASSATTTAVPQLGNGGSFTVVSNHNYDAYGHTTTQTNTTFQLPTILPGSIGVVAERPGQLVFTLQDQNNQSTTAAFSATATLYHTITVDGTTATVLNQGDLGSFYSAGHIDEILKTIDALTYKGTLGAVNGDTIHELPTTATNGDTYKVSTSATYLYGNKEYKAKVGDLFIASGVENTATGVIPSGSVDWTFVPGSGDADTQYNVKINPINGGGAEFGIQELNNNESLSKKITVNGDSWVSVSAVAGTNSGTLALSHNGPSTATSGVFGTTAATTLGAGGSFVIPTITKDSKGHIVTIQNTTITLPDPGTYILTPITASNAIQLQNSNAGMGNISFEGTGPITATVSATSTTAGKVTIAHVAPTGYSATATATTAGVAVTSATASNRQITAITGIARDDKGHTTNYTTTTYTIDQIDPKLVFGFDENNGVATISLQDNNAVLGSAISLQSLNKTIEFTNTTGTVVNAEIVWGGF